MIVSDAVRGVEARLAAARVVICDFDGTLVLSNEIKFRAFDLCFSDADDRRDEIAAYCRTGHHTPRDDKFRHVCEVILRRPYTEALRRELHARFEAATTCAIVGAPEVAGAGLFLRRIAHTHTLGLLSSTPDAILRSIVERRRWASYFALVKGAPVEKAAWLRDVRAERGLAPAQLVMFGDTAEDAAAASAAGCAFVGIGADACFGGAACHLPDFTALAGEAAPAR